MAVDQGESWVNLAGNGVKDPASTLPVVGQIYFRTNETALDDDDRDAIESIAVGLKRYFASEFGPHLRPFEMGLVGYADYRGAASYNLNLSLKRADMVRLALDEHFLGAKSTFYWRSRYRSLARGAGEGAERAPARLDKDRRVNIVMAKTYPQKIDFPGTEIRVSPRNKNISRHFLMRTRIGASATIPGAEISAQALFITIRNARSGEEIDLQFAALGGAIGLPFGVNRPTDFQPFTTPYFMETTDFIGKGRLSSASLGFDGASIFEFFGPLENGVAPASDIAAKKPLSVPSTGWDFNVGLGGVEGLWEQS
ncbi:OmpA family protein [Methylocella silvestris]|nr:OmpA family protein [Methylocella silvestris]